MIGLFDEEYKSWGAGSCTFDDGNGVVVSFHQRHGRDVRLSYGAYLACALVAGDNTLQRLFHRNNCKGKNKAANLATEFLNGQLWYCGKGPRRGDRCGILLCFTSKRKTYHEEFLYSAFVVLITSFCQPLTLMCYCYRRQSATYS